MELSEEAEQRARALEHNKSEFGKAEAELKKVSEEVLHQRKEEKELEAMYRRNVCNFKFGFEIFSRKRCANNLYTVIIRLLYSWLYWVG